MELLALLSNRDEIIPAVKNSLKKYTLYPLRTLDELEDLYRNIPLKLLIIDTLSCKLSSVSEFLDGLEKDTVVLITAEKLNQYTSENLPGSVCASIDIESISTELPVIVGRAIERQKLKNEISLLKKSREEFTPVQAPVCGRSELEMLSVRSDPVPSGKYIHEKVIVNFAKMLSVSFDMQKLFNHFIDSVMEIARVSKMSIMLKKKEGFYVKTHYGLDPKIADNLMLGRDSSLVSWLTRTGRIMQRPSSFIHSESINIKNEMDALQCSVSFPMIYKGRLIGIFNIDNKITEEPFYTEELEIIYVLCNYLAAAVKDIDLYHQMWYQKEFTNNILSSMNSGMIAIDKEERVTIFNQLASEILDLSDTEIVGRDLRALPSPLGDILYETMVRGTTYKRYEVTINPSKMPLGINSYRLIDEQQNPVGAGIIFSDLSDSKKLQEQRNRAEKLKAVNMLMAKIAHEVRNPLTSIQTFTQLLNEKYADDDLNKFYISTVSQSIRMLDGLIDKLVSFSSSQDYFLRKEEIGSIMEEVEGLVLKSIPDTHTFVKKLSDKDFFINVDKKQLIKAIYYLVLSIIERTPDGTKITMNTAAKLQDSPFIEIMVKYLSDNPIENEKESLLKPLLDIKHLGTELNVPLSLKIIEGHNGSLEMKSEGDMNAFIIKLPLIDRRSSDISVEGGQISEQQK